MRSSWCRTAALLGVVALIGAACADEAEETGGEGERPTVVFQGFPADPAALPLLVMQEEGFDEENGFVGEYLAVDPDAATNTFLIGESDIAMEQDGINMTIVQQEGHEAVLFAPGLNMMNGIAVLEESNYEILREEPYKSFLELKSDEELEAFIDYCVNLPCFGTTWTEEDIQGLNDYLELFAQHA